jgi:ribosomal protein L1
MNPEQVGKELIAEMQRLKDRRFTGSMSITINLSQGSIGDIMISEQWKLKNGNGKKKDIDTD